MGQDEVRTRRTGGARTCADGNTFLTDLTARLAVYRPGTAITRLHHQSVLACDWLTGSQARR